MITDNSKDDGCHGDHWLIDGGIVLLYIIPSYKYIYSRKYHSKRCIRNHFPRTINRNLTIRLHKEVYCVYKVALRCDDYDKNFLHIIRNDRFDFI